MQWLLRLTSTAPEAFSLIPEYVVLDMTAWLCFLIRQRRAGLLGGIPMADVMALVTRLVGSRTLVASGVVQVRACRAFSARRHIRQGGAREGRGDMMVASGVV